MLGKCLYNLDALSLIQDIKCSENDLLTNNAPKVHLSCEQTKNDDLFSGKGSGTVFSLSMRGFASIPWGVRARVGGFLLL